MSSTQAVLQERVEPERGQVYEGGHGTTYQLIYVDDRVVLMRYATEEDYGHRLETRLSFDESKDAGFFDYKPDSDVEMFNSTTIDWTDVDNIGDKTCGNMYDAGYETVVDVQQASDDELLDVGGLGSAGLSNLRQFVR